MKTTIILKCLDPIIQLCAFFIPLVTNMDGGGILTGWVALGAAQTISCGINRVALTKAQRSAGRKFYQAILVVILVIFCLTAMLHDISVYDNKLVAVVRLLTEISIAVSPILAVWYLIISVLDILSISAQDQPLDP